MKEGIDLFYKDLYLNKKGDYNGYKNERRNIYY